MKKSKLVRSTSMILAVLTVALTFFSTFVMPAGAAFSLPYIEEIKESKQNSGSAYKIVEIAPTADTGNMGYYVDGQEPSSVRGWSTRIASIQNASERSSYVNGILSKLKDTGLMSATENAAPLHLSGNYVEHYGWDSDASTYIGDSATTPANKLTLDQTETFLVTGKIVEMPDETGGDYNLTYNYNLADGGNLFVYSKWRASTSSAISGNSTSGDSVSFDDENKTFSVITDSVGGGSDVNHDVYTNQEATTSNFVVTLKPNSAYTFSFDVETNGNAQAFVFAADASRSTWNSNYVISSSNGKYNGAYLSTGHYDYTFYTGTNAKYLTFRFGNTTANTTSTFSNVTLYKLSTQNLFSYSSWYDSSSKSANNSSNGTISYDKTNGSVTLTASSTSSDYYTYAETSNGFYKMSVEPNTTYNITYVNSVSSGNSSIFAFVTASDGNLWASSGSLIKSASTKSLTRSYNTYREYQHSSGVHTFSITTGSDAKYLTLRMGPTAVGQTVTFGDIWVSKANNILKGSTWINTVTESSQVTKDATAGTVTLTSTAAALASTRSSYTTTTFDTDTTYTIRFKVTFDEDKTTNAWRQGFLQTYVNGGSYSNKYFTTDGIYELSLDTADWMESISFNFIVSSPNTTFTISDINIVSSSAAGDKDEDTPEYVQDIKYFEYGEAETEYGSNLFSLSKWSSNSKSFSLSSSSTTGDTVTADLESNSFTIVNDGSGSADMYTNYGGSADYYFMNVEPNTTYQLSFTIKATSGVGQFYIFPCGSGLAMDTSNTGATVTPAGGTATWAMGLRSKGTGTYTQTFTTNKDTLYLQIRAGTDSETADITFSDVTIKEIQNPVNYYYSVTPTEYSYYMKDTDGNRILPDDGTVLYTINDDGHYEYYGVYKSDGTGVKIFTDVHYYSLAVSDDCWPTDTFSAGQPYRAISDSFRSVKTLYDDEGNITGTEKGYFTRDYDTLTYVGDKSGNANIDLTGTDQLTVLTNIVYYTGGYENNDWFRYRVLDADDTTKNEDGETVEKYTFPITVTTITPDDDNLENTLRTADLIVITGGVDVLGTGEAKYKTETKEPDGSTTTSITDIPDDKIDSIISTVSSYVKNKMPIIIDTAVYTSSDTPDNLMKLCQSVTTDTTGKVNGNIYTFSASQIGVTALANSKFLDVFTSSAYNNQNTSPYYPVYNELQQEENYRELKSLTSLTDEQEKINEASVIRYIINYKKQRLYQTLSTLKVLDIEPISTQPTITVDMINSMLPEDNQYDAKNINIVTMSVAEFIGKNENFDEEYDLVYIGSSNNNMNTIENGTDSAFTFSYMYKDDDGNTNTDTATVTNGVFDTNYQNRLAAGMTRQLKVGSPIYNDESLNGYYYTNVGDKITTTTDSIVNVSEGISYPYLSGLLAEDYVSIGDMLDEYEDQGGISGWFAGLASDAIESITGDVHARYWVKGGHATFRTTGADINQAALERLQSYIDAGRPVIISNDLTTKETSVTLKAVANVSMTKPTSTTYKFDFTCKLEGDIPEDAVVTYQWFRNDGTSVSAETGMQASGTFSKTVTSGKVTYENGQYTYNFNGNGTYYCEVNISYNGNYTVKSNDCIVDPGSKQYKMYMRCWDVGTKSKWDWMGWVKRENYTYYVDLSDGLPQDWSVTYQWQYDTYGEAVDWDNDGTDTTYTKNAKATRVLMTFHYIDDTGTSQELTMNVKKYGGSDTKMLYSRVDGDFGDDVKEYDEQGRLYKWRDLSTGSHGSDYHPSDGFDTPFVYTLGNLTAKANTNYGTVTISAPSEINTDAVDNCSYMYQFLINNYYRDKDTKNGADNMFNVTDGQADTNLLASCFKISKPEIEFVRQPAEYPSQLTSRSLDFTYYIRDNSNPKDNVTYTSYLYIDSNSDGKFSDYEKQTGKTVSNNPISKGTQNNLCTMSYTLPSSLTTSIIAWKLEVVENVDTNTSYQGTASYEGYSYLKTDEPTKITAIMILPGAWNHDYKSLESMIANKDSITVDGKSYVFKDTVSDYFGADKYIGNVFESEVFDNLDGLERLTNEELGVGDDGYGNDGLYHMGFDVNNGDIQIDIAITNIHDMNTKFTADPDSDFFTQYSMMIMGFGDEWGKTTSTWTDDLLGVIDNTIPEGFEIETAEAVCDYINAGYSTLFCHDTLNKNVNFVNLYWDKAKKIGTSAMETVMSGVNTVIKWINKLFGSEIPSYNVSDDEYKDSRVRNGYWNNLIMRDTLGLDRYGITYAIKTRAQTISDGNDHDSVNTSYAGQDIYSDAVLGRSHMYEYIYDYPYASETITQSTVIKDSNGNVVFDSEGNATYQDTTITRNPLDVESMLEKGYSIAYVPGTAETFERAPDADSMVITVEDRAVKSGETVVKTYGEDSDNPIKLVATASTIKFNQYIDDTSNLPTLYYNGKEYGPKDYTVDTDDGNKIKERKKDIFGVYHTKSQIGTLQLDGTLVVDSSLNPVTATVTKYSDYHYLGKVYEKGTQQIVDKYDGSYTTIYYGVEAESTVVNGVKTYTVYAGMPIRDSDGNIIADWDEYTQGFTDYVLQRYMDTDSTKLNVRTIFEKDETGMIETDKITQVNRGKITTYPYDINNDDMFDLTGKTTEQTMAAMNTTYDIKTTHEQVYQCNMNGDDITVWYALAGGKYYDPDTNTGVRNDCANAYYIYSRDNLIYTGAGHTNEFSEMEAKLFINTLVSSYRPAITAPSAAFRNKFDTSNVKYVLVLPTVDENNNVTLKASDYIYFKFHDENTSDPTLFFTSDTEYENGQEDTTEVLNQKGNAYYYIDGEQKIITSDTMPLYIEQKNGDGSIIYTTKTINGKEVQVPLMESATETTGSTINTTSTQKLSSDLLYAFEVPDAIINEFNNDSNLTSITLYMRPAVSVKSGGHNVNGGKNSSQPTVMVGETQKIEIRVLHLSDLS